MTAAQSDPSVTPPLTARRLLYVGTGGLQAMFMPVWLHWLRTHYPDTELRYVVTRGALRFTTTTALKVNGQVPGLIDEWPDEPEEAIHVELSEWADAVIVHPATMHFTARLALGMADTPTLLALQCTAASIVVCPSLPPGGHLNPVHRQHVEALEARPNVAVLPPVEGISMHSGKTGIGTPAPFPAAVAALDQLRSGVESLAHG